MTEGTYFEQEEPAYDPWIKKVFGPNRHERRTAATLRKHARRAYSRLIARGLSGMAAHAS